MNPILGVLAAVGQGGERAGGHVTIRSGRPVSTPRLLAEVAR